MNILKKCCYRSLKNNPKRTAVTIIGIILATALITGVACMAVSFRASMVAFEKENSGDYHYCFIDVDSDYLKLFRNNVNVEEYGLVEEVGYARLEGSQNPDKPYLYVCAMDEKAEGMLALHLAEGRMPENDTELVISRHIRSNGLVDIGVGDVLELGTGSRMSEGYRLNQETAYLYEEEILEQTGRKEYTIVGIIERPNENVEGRMAPGYSVYTRLETPAQTGILTVYARYTDWGVHHASKVTAGILGVSEELYERASINSHLSWEEEQQVRKVAKYVEENYELLRWVLMVFSSGLMNAIYSMAVIGIVISVLTSVFCIRNSFVISLTEKMKLYGRLASVGTTSGQQRKIVLYEAAALGIVGIPLGILCGIAATAILVLLVGGMVEDAVALPLHFAVSPGAILLAAVLAAVTILLSASKSARRAAEISPISAIRSNDTIRIKGNRLRCPGTIGSLFGIGGRIAYKNLKRAKVKYRTTVISIAVSVAIYIGMSTFASLVAYANGLYNENLTYEMRVSIWNHDYEKAVQIAQLDGVKRVEISRRAGFLPDWTQIPYTDLGRRFAAQEGMIQVKTLGEEEYARFCAQVGVSVEEAVDKAIVLAHHRSEYRENGKILIREGELAEFASGDVIRGTGAKDVPVEIQVLTQTDVCPMSMENGFLSDIQLIVSDEWMDSHPLRITYDNIEIYIQCENADQLEEIIRNDFAFQGYTVTNYEAQLRSERSLYLTVFIFLYGFITVIALIGITNIFNTITTNMELRAPEFAMLKSVGMTGREFRRMIWLEGFFYGGKALLIGIPLGIIFSFCFHMAMNSGIVMEFVFPWKGIATAAAAVILLLYGIMHYSMAKINRQNIIQTIQNENI